jgi:hypothetical protein
MIQCRSSLHQASVRHPEPFVNIGIAAVAAGVLLLFAAAPTHCLTRYHKDRNCSAITATVAANIRGIITAGASLGRHLARFIKIGDSITASDPESRDTPNSYFLCQFICPDYSSSSKAWDYTRNLDSFKNALSPALQYFLSDTLADGTTSFNRSSAAAKVGMGADWATDAIPSPMRKEIDSVDPQFAVIMYGANDAGGYGSLASVLDAYMRNMRKIVDTCIASGVVPILTATCPRLDKMETTLAMSHLIRGLSQYYQIPFIDYHRAMMPLQNHGMGSDGLHPSTYEYNRHCWFTAEGLGNGYNMRNLLTLQALDRLYRLATTSVASLDPEPSALEGTGAKDSPFVIDGVSFIDAQTTSAGNPDVYYRLTLGSPLKARILVTCQNSTKIGLDVRDGASGAMIADTESYIDRDLPAGTYEIKLFAKGTKSGAYQFALIDRDDDGLPGAWTDIRGFVKPVFRQTQGVRAIARASTIVISVTGPGEAALFDVRGKRFWRASLPSPGTHSVKLPPQTSGVRFLRYCSGNQMETRTIVGQ